MSDTGSPEPSLSVQHVLFTAVLDNNNTYTIDIGRVGTVVRAIDNVVVAVTGDQVTNWVVEYSANRNGYVCKANVECVVCLN